MRRRTVVDADRFLVILPSPINPVRGAVDGNTGIGQHQSDDVVGPWHVPLAVLIEKVHAVIRNAKGICISLAVPARFRAGSIAYFVERILKLLSSNRRAAFTGSLLPLEP